MAAKTAMLIPTRIVVTEILAPNAVEAAGVAEMAEGPACAACLL